MRRALTLAMTLASPFIGCDRASSTADSHRPTNATTIPASWASARSDDQAFEVRAPRALVEQPSSGPSASGTTTRSWRGQDAEGTRYVVLSFTFPAIANIGGTSVMLDVVRDRTARGLDSNVTSEDRTSVQGQDARRLRMESTLGGDTVRSEAMVIRGRTEGRVYVLIVQPRSGSPRDDDTRRFFDSFHML